MSGKPDKANFTPVRLKYNTCQLPDNYEAEWNDHDVLVGPGEIEYSWDKYSKFGAKVTDLVAFLPRYDPKTRTYPMDKHGMERLKPLKVEVAVFDPVTHLSNPNGVLLTACYPGGYRFSGSDSSVGVVTAAAGIDNSKGMPNHSKAYTVEYKKRKELFPVLNRLNLKSNDSYQGIWCMEVQEGMTQDRVVEAYSVLKKYAEDVAFFKNTELMLPLIGFSSHAKVSLGEVIEQVMSWVYHCYLHVPNLTKITFICPTERHVDEIVNGFEGIYLVVSIVSPLTLSLSPPLVSLFLLHPH